MSKVIMVGCDLHDANLMLMLGDGPGESLKRCFRNCPERIDAMIDWLKQFAARAAADRIIFAYEASSQGFGLCDQLRQAGIECYVIAPTHLPKTAKCRKNKTDEKDAMMLLELLRGHVLGGNKLPTVCVPGHQMRQDREIVRARLDARDKASAVKTQIISLLKRNAVRPPAGCTRRWTRAHRAWLGDLALPLGIRLHLDSLLRQLHALEEEIHALDQAVKNLSEQPRYAAVVRALTGLTGVGVLTAMVFLTEVGQMNRFTNRRKLASYLGLAPSSHASGQRSDRQGHITRQGPARVRRALCQAVWIQIRYDARARAAHERIARGSKQRRKIATVALMRQLAVRLWHIAKQAG